MLDRADGSAQRRPFACAPVRAVHPLTAAASAHTLREPGLGVVSRETRSTVRQVQRRGRSAGRLAVMLDRADCQCTETPLACAPVPSEDDWEGLMGADHSALELRCFT